MIDTPDILDLPAQKTAIIHLTVPASDIMKVMGRGIQEVRDVLAAQGIEPTGPWFTHHLKMPGQTFDFEICLPVDRDVTPHGRVVPGEIRAARTARTVYRGGYESLGQGWGEFMAWIQAQGLTPAGDLWEAYVTGPEAGPDSSLYATQLNRPLL